MENKQVAGVWTDKHMEILWNLQHTAEYEDFSEAIAYMKRIYTDELNHRMNQAMPSESQLATVNQDEKVGFTFSDLKYAVTLTNEHEKKELKKLLDESEPVPVNDDVLINGLLNKYDALKDFSIGFYYWTNENGSDSDFQDYIETEDGNKKLKTVIQQFKSNPEVVPVQEGLKEEYVEGLKKLLRLAKCPEILIENPNILSNKKITPENRKWAEGVIQRYIAANEPVDEKEK